jgi:hypothetical protein
LFDPFVAREACKVEAGEVERGFAGAEEFGFGPVGADDDGDRREVRFFPGGKRLREGRRVVVVHQLVDFLLDLEVIYQTILRLKRAKKTFSENWIKCFSVLSARVRDWRRVRTAKRMRMSSRSVRPGSFWWDDLT